MPSGGSEDGAGIAQLNYERLAVAALDALLAGGLEITQDYPYFPHERHTMLAAVIHFDDAPLEKGCIRVVPESHKRGPIEHDPQGGFHLPFDRYPLEASVACPARAGDVLFFNYLTIHGSGVNLSQEARTTLLVQMRDPEDKPTVKTHESRGQGMMLRGYDPMALPPEAQQRSI